MSLSMVVLPQPDGPSSASVVPRRDAQRHLAQRHVSAGVDLAYRVELDHARRPDPSAPRIARGMRRAVPATSALTKCDRAASVCQQQHARRPRSTGCRRPPTARRSPDGRRTRPSAMSRSARLIGPARCACDPPPATSSGIRRAEHVHPRPARDRRSPRPGRAAQEAAAEVLLRRSRLAAVRRDLRSARVLSDPHRAGAAAARRRGSIIAAVRRRRI